MKKTIEVLVRAIIVFAVAITITAGAMTLAGAEQYPNCGVVVELDVYNDVVYVQDFFGEVWSFYGVENWHIGDIAAMTMDDMETIDILDDEIIKVVHCGEWKILVNRLNWI